MKNIKLTSSDFYKLLAKVDNIVEMNINKKITLDFNKITNINSNLKFIEVEFKNSEYKLMRNNQESNTIRVLTDYVGDMYCTTMKYNNSHPFITIIKNKQDNKDKSSFIYDSYYIKDNIIFIEDRNMLLDYSDLGESVFLSNRKYRELFNKLVLDKRNDIWNQIHDDINILMNTATTSRRALQISRIILKMNEITWSI